MAPKEPQQIPNTDSNKISTAIIGTDLGFFREVGLGLFSLIKLELIKISTLVGVCIL